MGGKGTDMKTLSYGDEGKGNGRRRVTETMEEREMGYIITHYWKKRKSK